MSVGGPTGEARPPRTEVLASTLLAACNGDYSVAIRLLGRTRDVLIKAQGATHSAPPRDHRDVAVVVPIDNFGKRRAALTPRSDADASA